MTAPLSPDGKRRCFGFKQGQDLYARYHDQEWGVPDHNDQKLFEMLVLEGAQAGLSWETVLKKRIHYRAAFYEFDPERVARMSDQDLEACLKNPGLIRNRLKIFAARRNAQSFLEIQRSHGSFAKYLWAYVGGNPIQNHYQKLEELPAQTCLSQEISKDLKRRGMTFVGPTIIYAYLQSVGVVNDHLESCWLRCS